MSIFVAIPSYRDSECKHTVEDLYKKADNPDTIYVGICNQIDPEEDSDLVLNDLPRQEQVRVVQVDCRKATGPCYARSITQSLWKGEQYYLQIDSHMRFVKGWDSILKKNLEKTKNPEKSIITSYPVGYEQPNKVPSYKNACFLVARGFGEDGMLRLDGKLLKQCLNDPKQGCFWVSGFAFSSSKVIQEVPYDPTLEFLFFGEEMSMSARLWTHGWDFYCPGTSVIYHLWTRSYRKTFREVVNPDKQIKEQQSKEKVWRMLNMPPITPATPTSVSTPTSTESTTSPTPATTTSESSTTTTSTIRPTTSESTTTSSSTTLAATTNESTTTTTTGQYGLGTERTLEEYSQYCGVDFQNRKIANKGKLGGLQQSDFVDAVLDMVMKASPLISLD